MTKPETNATAVVQSLYRKSAATVRSRFDESAEYVTGYYHRYVDFVSIHSKLQARILDVGCGNGWTTAQLRRMGHDAIGSDIHEGQKEIMTNRTTPYVCGDVRMLPFADNTFDTVAMNAVLEHVPCPEAGLRECLRVVRRGGRLIVVGPNLLSVGMALKCTFSELCRLVCGGRLRRRTEDTPIHPFGNTIPEALSHLWHHLFHTTVKIIGERPVRFLMREPDTRPPFYADNDSCYYCNPMDLIQWSRQSAGTRVLKWWSLDRPASRLLWPLLGGTWIVIEKI